MCGQFRSEKSTGLVEASPLGGGELQGEERGGGTLPGDFPVCSRPSLVWSDPIRSDLIPGPSDTDTADKTTDNGIPATSTLYAINSNKW